MKQTRKIIWIEKKSGESGLSGPARIGRVSFSISGKSIKYNGKTFQLFLFTRTDPLRPISFFLDTGLYILPEAGRDDADHAARKLFVGQAGHRILINGEETIPGLL